MVEHAPVAGSVDFIDLILGDRVHAIVLHQLTKERLLRVIGIPLIKAESASPACDV